MIGQPDFTPTRAAGLARLGAFAPNMGRDYAQSRNFDFGPGQRQNVSCLSAHVRHRLILECELARAALEAHSPTAAEKFIQEVFWRTYWKGWLEMRPAVWTRYQQEVDDALDQVSHNRGRARAYEDAVSGRTGIACFDEWAGELLEEGYLHNHARMWFASIWIFTLKLPWALGADFFLRHLIDGDAASNTLSWRWVAGLQTQGKAYAAAAGNIEKFTDGRFHVSAQQLAQRVEPMPWEDPPGPVQPDLISSFPAKPYTLFVHEEDCALDAFVLAGGVDHILVQASPAARSKASLGAAAQRFTQGALDDAFERAKAQANCSVERLPLESVAHYADKKTVAAAHIPVGPVRDSLKNAGICMVARAEDAFLWPYATKGFFKFKKAIPSALDALGLQVT